MNFNLRLFGGRGGSSGGGGGGGAITQRGYEKLLQTNQEKIDTWLNGRGASSLTLSNDENYFERYTMKQMKEIVKEDTQFGKVPEDISIHLRYKDGRSESYVEGDDFDYNSIKWSTVSTIKYSNPGSEAYAGSSKTVTIEPATNYNDYKRSRDLNYQLDI